MCSYLSLIKKMEINHDELHRGVEFFLNTYMSMSSIDLEKVSKVSEQVLGCAISARMFRLLEVESTKIYHIIFQRNQNVKIKSCNILYYFINQISKH